MPRATCLPVCHVKHCWTSQQWHPARDDEIEHISVLTNDPRFWLTLHFHWTKKAGHQHDQHGGHLRQPGQLLFPRSYLVPNSRYYRPTSPLPLDTDSGVSVVGEVPWLSVPGSLRVWLAFLIKLFRGSKSRVKCVGCACVPFLCPGYVVHRTPSIWFLLLLFDFLLRQPCPQRGNISRRSTLHRPLFPRGRLSYFRARQRTAKRGTRTETIVKLPIEKLPEGGYLATSDEVQGLIAQGRTIQETLEIARDVAKKLIEAR